MGRPAISIVREPQRRADLGPRLAALERLISLSEDRLDADRLNAARDVVARATDRLACSLGHTVVAFAGASGSGKSSLFNVIAGLGLSPVSVRRPTTVSTVACVWDPAGIATARPLLDRINVPRRQQVVRQSPLDRVAEDDLTGLVLLDLPDYDSAVRNHRAEVDRAVGLADAIIWVTDPQKYADAIWHDRYLRGLAHHAEVQLVLLNQIDKLPEPDASTCVEDLSQLLAGEGLAEVPVIAVSARAGIGLAALRAKLVELTARGDVALRRLSADVDRVIAELADDCLGPESEAVRNGAEPGVLPDASRDQITARLEQAAGLDALADTVTNAYLRRAEAATGSVPLTIWRSRRERARVRRLSGPVRAAAEPAPAPVQRTGAETAVAELVETAVRDMPQAWGEAVRAIGESSTGELIETLDATLANTVVRAETSTRWWVPARACQWACLTGVLAGVVGTIALVAPDMDHALPRLDGLPDPVWLLAIGALGSALVSLLSRLARRRAAFRLRESMVATVRERIDHAVTALVVEPVREELARYREMREEYRLARGR
jgi:GTP-binding protein EngB required for normal cell division